MYSRESRRNPQTNRNLPSDEGVNHYEPSMSPFPPNYRIASSVISTASSIKHRTASGQNLYNSCVRCTADGVDRRPRCGEVCVHVGCPSLCELGRSGGLTGLAMLANAANGIIKGGSHDSQSHRPTPDVQDPTQIRGAAPLSATPRTFSGGLCGQWNG